MNKLYEATKQLLPLLKELGLPYCLVGGLAAIRWGEPRFTKDVDLCIFTEIDADEKAVDFFLSRLSSRISDAREFALRRRVILLTSANGVDLDIFLPFESQMIERSLPFDLGENCVVPTASAEDVIVMKTIAGRPRDWNDIEGILRRQKVKLDFHYVFRQLAELCQFLDSDICMTTLRKVIERERNAAR